MKATESLQLNAFLTALTQLDGKLPVDLQNQLNDIGKEFPTSVSKLGTLAKSYSPLDKIYKEARRVLRSHEGERLRFTTPDPEETARSNDEEIIGLAVYILNSSNSVASAKRAAKESGVFKQLLVQLQGETSFSMPDTHLAHVGASQERSLQYEYAEDEQDVALAIACALVDELELGWGAEWQTAAITDWEASGL